MTIILQNPQKSFVGLLKLRQSLTLKKGGKVTGATPLPFPTLLSSERLALLKDSDPSLVSSLMLAYFHYTYCISTA